MVGLQSIDVRLHMAFLNKIADEKVFQFTHWPSIILCFLTIYTICLFVASSLKKLSDLLQRKIILISVALQIETKPFQSKHFQNQGIFVIQ